MNIVDATRAAGNLVSEGDPLRIRRGDMLGEMHVIVPAHFHYPAVLYTEEAGFSAARMPDYAVTIRDLLADDWEPYAPAVTQEREPR